MPFLLGSSSLCFHYCLSNRLDFYSGLEQLIGQVAEIESLGDKKWKSLATLIDFNLIFDLGEEPWVLQRKKNEGDLCSSYLLYCDPVDLAFKCRYTELQKLSRFLLYKLKTVISKTQCCRISLEFKTEETLPGLDWKDFGNFVLKFNNRQQQTIEVHRASFFKGNDIQTDFFFYISPKLLGLWTCKERRKRKTG